MDALDRRSYPRPEGSAVVAIRLRRAWRLGWQSAGRGVVEFYRSSNLTFAASIAYYSLLSMFPFVLLVLSILNRWSPMHNDTTLLDLIARALPSHFEFVSTQIQTLARTPLQLGVAGTIVALAASMGVFGAITSAVNHAWGVEEPIGFFRHKLVQAQWFAGVISYSPALARFSGLAYRNAPTPMFILVVGLIYYYAPNAQVRLRDVWFGAVLAGLLWRLTFAAFAWYVRDLTRFSIHGQVTAVVLFLVWIYLSAVILLYGVEVTAAYARLRQNLPPQGPAAPAREG
jgi:membrane protein